MAVERRPRARFAPLRQPAPAASEAAAVAPAPAVALAEAPAPAAEEAPEKAGAEAAPAEAEAAGAEAAPPAPEGEARAAEGAGAGAAEPAAEATGAEEAAPAAEAPAPADDGGAAPGPRGESAAHGAAGDAPLPAAHEPKVMAQFRHRVGETPRKVLIERKKRLFAAQSLDTLLLEQGVDLDVLGKNDARWTLPLSSFDDTEFECRQPSEWVCPGAPVPARALMRVGDAAEGAAPAGRAYAWRQGKVLAYREASNAYRVAFDGEDADSAEWVDRMFVWFLSEDPFVWARRFGAAVKARALAETMLRYNLFVDSMPTEDIPLLTVEQINRILSFSLNSKKLKDKLMDTSQLISEINVDYARTMNRIVFDVALRDGEVADILPIKEEFPQEARKEAPACGTVAVPAYDFPECFSEFSFHTFLTKPEVISAMIKVRTECTKVSRLSLFQTYYTKSSRLEEFHQTQVQANDATANSLKESWVTRLRNDIRSSFKDAGKGWYNVHETSHETYEGSKLKRFNTMTKLIMEDSLRYIVEESLSRFTAFVERTCMMDVRVGSSFDVEVSPYVVSAAAAADAAQGGEAAAAAAAAAAAPAADAARRPPLLSLEVFIGTASDDDHAAPAGDAGDGEAFRYATPLAKFKPTFDAMFSRALTSVQNINVLEPSIMEGLFWSQIESLNVVHPLEPHVQAWRERLHAAVDKAVGVAEAYLATLGKFDSIRREDPKTAIAELEALGEELTLDRIKKEIDRNAEELALLEDEMPVAINIGAFSVSLKKTKEQLLTKKSTQLSMLKLLLAQQPRNEYDSIIREFNGIYEQLRVKTATIEDVDAMRKFIEEIPKLVRELQERIMAAQVYFEALDHYQCALSEEDFKVKCATESWNTKIDRQIVRTEEALVEDQEAYENEQREEQDSFNNQLGYLTATVEGFSSNTNLEEVDAVYKNVTDLSSQLKTALEEAAKFNSREALFEKPLTDYSGLKKVVDQFEPYKLLWTTAYQWKEKKQSYMEDSFVTLDADEIDKNVQNWWRTVFKQGKGFNVRDLPKCAACCENIREEIDEFKPYVPLIQAMRNPGMRDRHWEKISSELGMTVFPDESFTLSKAIEMGLHEHIELITKISDVAGKEYSIETALDKMQGEWASCELGVMDYRETGTYVIKVDEQTTQQLDDHIVMTQSMTFSPFKKPFEQRINEWEKQLNLVSEILDEWLAVQRSWMYLSPIFEAPDIQEQLPLESKRFMNVDRFWRKTLGQAKNTPHVLTMCAGQKLLEQFADGNKMLESVQKSLAEYLETKRLAFSRFFFLSNDELLQILSQTKNPLAVQPHLKKCFEAIESLDFSDTLEITAMNSKEKEKVAWPESMYPKGNVETWLGTVESRMRSSLHHHITSSVADYAARKRSEWVRNWPAMVTLGVSAVYWTKNVEHGITEAELELTYDRNVSDLMDLTELVRGNLSKQDRNTLGALITIDVHARDTVQILVDNNVSSLTEFLWVSQLRYYWETKPGDSRDEIWVKMVQASIIFGYEYLGNTPRLVVTPLTDRCYMTLMGAMHLNLGGAPAGPAGTGKTETTKDLAKALAKQCVVFNCSDGLDFLAMAKFFKGLASSGAWACFDEFNRIDLEVLSVIAQQILTIQLAIQQGLQRFVFEDTEISLNPACSVYITMNPGYAGRSELPDNLKALFRPCAMMVPDYALIGEVSLYSFGFKESRNLARKMVATFRLCSEQLSSQDHYDYGMRAVKSVITAAGNLKRDFPDDDENVLLLRGLSDVNVPKFLSHDLPLFFGIIKDLFPGLEKPKIDYSELLNAVEAVCGEMNVQPVEIFETKILQLYEMTIVRHGLMLVGPTGGGKTSGYRCLANAMSLIKKEMGEDSHFESVKYVVLNPKAITMGQLYGEFDEQTHEWTDGVLACYMRDLAAEDTPQKKWLMFDGPVDAIWIENMNTVLDDNKKLCLVSGEIIQLSSTMTMMFEVEDLAVASPATVSRCGMVYVEPTSLGMEPLFDSWINLVPHPLSLHKDLMRAIFALVPDLVRHVRKYMKETVGTTNNNLTASCFHVMDGLTKEFVRDPETEDPLSDDLVQAYANAAGKLMVFSVIWSIGASVKGEFLPEFDKELRGRLSAAGFDEHAPPAGKPVYDFVYNVREGAWVEWMSTIPEFKVNPEVAFSDIIVPTADTVRYMFVVEHLLKSGAHVLCVGGTGTGKTLNLNNLLMNGMGPTFAPIAVTFSARTSANQTQDMIDGKLDKRRKGVFGPPAGTRYVVYVDDMNMPEVEKYGAQPPIEVLRQWMDHAGWYERKPPCAFKTLIDIQFLGSMGPPGGGRNPVTMRFLRHFNYVSFSEMSDASIHRIFDTILSATLNRAYHGRDDIAALGSGVVSATIGAYNTIRKELLPTPSKSMYVYNLRDFAKVVQGVMRADAKVVVTADSVLALWLHECSRVFGDRLITNADSEWFLGMLDSCMQENLGKAYKDVVTTERLMFADYLVPGADPKLYTQVSDFDQLGKVINDYLEDYNSVNTTPMRLVMFLDAIDHVSRISRVISLPLGNSLLLGVGGSGRQSLTRLAAYIAEFDLHQIEITKNYGNNEWKDDLKKVLLKAGCEDKQVVFLFCDTQIVKESMLEDVGQLLNAGEVPNLMGNEEAEAINTAIRPVLAAQGIAATKMAVQTAFVSRVRTNLHIVLAFSPIGDAFRRRLRMFPSLLNCTTLNYFGPWPKEALKSVARTFLSDLPLEGDDQLASLVDMCVSIHQATEGETERYLNEVRRHNYVTPTSYLELLSTLITLQGEKREEIETMRKRLEIGLDKLLSTASQVEVMQKELTDLQPVLAKTQKEVDDMMVVISKDKAEADKTKEVVSKQEAEANEQAAVAKGIADSAQADLDKALPALDAAVASLKSLSRNDIVEVKSLSNPPDGVKLVMEVTCIFFEEKPVMVADPNKIGKKIPNYWDPAKKLLNDPTKFLDSLMQFDKDNIPQKVIDKVDPYIGLETFTPEAVAKVSKACTSICMWARAMHTYHNVALGVEPKRKALAEAQEKLDKTMGELAEAQAMLREVEGKIAELEKNLAAANKKKDELSEQVNQCTLKLERAEKLIGGLGGEKTRWQQTVVDLTTSLGNVVGDVSIAAASIAYAGVFTPTFRASLNDNWAARLAELELPHTKGASLISVLMDPVKVRAWTIAGLPSDNVSIENGIITQKARRWPLMIDPQGQANKWIKNMEKESGLDVVKLSDKDFLRTLENGVRFGRAVLMENILETLDAALEPLLLKQTFKQGGAEVIRIGDNVIPYHPDFRFYITTKLRNPHYSPETSVKVSLLNFGITFEGLEEQMLNTCVEQERPDLASQKAELVVSNAKMKRELKEIEDKILYLLSNSTGNILDDEVLIETLAQSKVTSTEITQKVAEAEKTEKVIDETRESYRFVANRASLLFFSISDLASVVDMYQYSLTWFVALFVRGLGEAEKAPDVPTRGAIINEFFTYSLYVNVCRSLFEEHKLMLSLLLTHKVMSNEGHIDADEWRFLLAGPAKLDITEKNPAPSWLIEKSWIEIVKLSELPAFKGFSAHFATEIEHYKGVFDLTDAHEAPLQGVWEHRLKTKEKTGKGSFQKLLFVRALRPDKCVSAIQSFVSEHMGQRFIEPPPFDLGACYHESTPTTPLIFVLSSGADPMADLLKLADEMRMSKKFEKVSLGQGQGPKAEKLIQMGLDRGMWVCLQNCHLATSWMTKLEQIVTTLEPDQVHKDFRLWLTSMPSPNFPVSVLQDGIKMTLEPPAGLKANLNRAFLRYSDDELNDCQKPAEWKKLLFAMSLFHAVIQDRRKFGPLGWNIRYDFTDGDLGVCNTQIRMFLNEYEEIPFQVIRFLCTEINYGGRVTDDKDRRLINNLIDLFINEGAADPNPETPMQFSPSGTYISPACTTQKAFLEHIAEYPIEPKPEIFGLHDNADITCDQNKALAMFSTVLGLQPRASSGGGKSRDELIGERCKEIEAGLPPLFDVEDVKKAYPVDYAQSMNTVLAQECIRYNGLLDVMKKTLAESQKALKGLVVMSPELEGVTDAIFLNKVPVKWEGKAYPSLKPLTGWTVDLAERLGFIQAWIDKGNPACYWISGLFFPQAFLTGTMQNFARKFQYPIDTISWDFKMMDQLHHKSIAQGPENGCYVHGMFAEGARWDDETHMLGESNPKELYTDFPVVWLLPVKDREKPTTGIYNCPVYKTLTRAGTLSTTGHSTNFVMMIEVPSDVPESHWINRSMALFTALAY